MSLTKLLIVLAVSCYEIKNRDTGKLENDGCTVHYIYSEDLIPCEDKDKKAAGHKPAKVTVPVGDYSAFKVVPAIYEATLDFAVDSNGKAVIKPKDFRYVSGIGAAANATKSAKTA